MDETVASLEGGEDPSDEDIAAAAEEAIVTRSHFDHALRIITRSVTDEMQDFYDDLVESLGGDATGDRGDSMIGFQ